MPHQRIRDTAHMSTTYGAQLKAARERKSLSRPQVADEVGCTAKYIQYLEDGAVERPTRSSKYLARIEEVVGLTGNDDPVLSQASTLQLAEALYRRVAEQEGQPLPADRPTPFEVPRTPAGLELIDDRSSDADDHGADQQRAHNGDDAPPTGAVQH